jgi:aspartate kinase
MPICVQKFGGTSMGDVDKIQNAARKVIARSKEGFQVVVVVSAMAGETNRLLGLAEAIDPRASARETDVLASAGEQVSIALMAIALQKMGQNSISFTGPQVGIVTDEVFGQARIRNIDNSKIQAQLDEGKVVVVAGFQGMTPETGEITTLGRGGSDTSAVALAAAMKADACEIYTDVDGVFTADPNIVPGAKKLDKISYDEMLELASMGAKVLHHRSVEFAKKFKVPLHVRCSFNDNPGTWVIEEVPEMEELLVSGVTTNTNEAKVSLLGVPDEPGVAAKVFDFIAGKNILVDMIIQNVGADNKNDISFTIPKKSLPDLVDIKDELMQAVKATRFEADNEIAKVSVIGVGMRSHCGVAARMFSTLAENGINIEMISTSEIKISCIIAEKHAKLAVEKLCKEFDLAE